MGIPALPSPAFSNAMNDINPNFDFRHWWKSPEWKLYLIGYRQGCEAVRDSIEERLSSVRREIKATNESQNDDSK